MGKGTLHLPQQTSDTKACWTRPGSYDAQLNKPEEERRRTVVLSGTSSLFFELVKHGPATSLTLFIGSVSPWVAAADIFVYPTLDTEPDTLGESADICGIKERKTSKENLSK